MNMLMFKCCNLDVYDTRGFIYILVMSDLEIENEL